MEQVEEENTKVRGKEGGQKTWTKQVEEENTKVRGKGGGQKTWMKQVEEENTKVKGKEAKKHGRNRLRGET